MRKIYLLFIFFSLALVGCKRDEPEVKLTECQRENIGYMAFKNMSNDAYDIWINGTYYAQMPANTYETKYKKYPAGRVYRIKVQQVSGYIFSPTVRHYQVTLNQCDEKFLTFP